MTRTHRSSRPWDPTPQEAAVTRGAVAVVAGLDEMIAQLQAQRTAALGLVLDVALAQRERYERVPVGERRTGEPVYDPDDMPVRSAVAEVSAATRISRRAAERDLNDAWMLEHAFPATAAAFTRGEIDRDRAAAVVGEGLPLVGAALRGEYEELVLPHARTSTVHGTRRAARRIAAHLAPEPFTERHERARRERSVVVRDLDDGMAELRLVDDAIVVHGAHDRLTQMARRITAARRKDRLALAEQARASEPVPRCDTCRDAPRPCEACAEARSASMPRCPACRDAPAPCDTCARDGAGDAGLRCDVCRNRPTACDDCLRAVAEIDALWARALADGLAAPGSEGAPMVTDEGVPVVDERSFDQIRTDLATDLLLAGSPVAEHVLDPTGLARLDDVHARVHITIPVTTLAGLDDEPADFSRYGPVPARLARRAAANAPNWARVFHHPDTGALLTVDRYAPTAGQKRYLRARDEVCAFPSCDCPAAGTDIDHTRDYAAGGPTDVTNMAHLCRRHHVLKHQTPWTPTLARDGTVIWRSPAGNTHVVRPRAVVKFVDAAKARTARERAPG